MQLTNPSFKFASTVVLAYPDTTRLAGYRAALYLLNALTPEHGLNDNDQCKCSVNVKPKELVCSTPDIDLQAESSEEISVLFSTPTSSPSLTFCFVNGLPAQEKISELVDSVLSLLEESGVERIVVPVAADLVGVKDSDRLWIRTFDLPEDTGGAENMKTKASHMGNELPSDANTNDAFLSTLDTILCVSGFKHSSILIHGDKRPVGSGYREKVVFGQEYADETDSNVAGALQSALAEALGVRVADKAGGSVVATRVQLDPESVSRELPPAFG
ncbi:hypothetical protein H4S06_004050 [Coemansia sp. BCRC 34490]|nr:hypothetical protein H4S06_004050 [Coemansia sp. BCRC 34490]